MCIYKVKKAKIKKTFLHRTSQIKHPGVKDTAETNKD